MHIIQTHLTGGLSHIFVRDIVSIDVAPVIILVIITVVADTIDPVARTVNTALTVAAVVVAPGGIALLVACAVIHLGDTFSREASTNVDETARNIFIIVPA